MTDVTAIDDPDRLLAACAAAAPRIRLSPAVEQLVDEALRERARPVLRAASLALRALDRLSRRQGRPTPPRVRALLAEVRAALRTGRAA